MTPKEKAENLIDKMETIVQPWESNQCALIAVEEIIEAIGGDKMSNHPTGIYWQIVKQEMKKILE